MFWPSLNVWPRNCLRYEFFLCYPAVEATGEVQEHRHQPHLGEMWVKFPHPKSKIRPASFLKKALFINLYASDKPRAAAGASGSGPGDETGGRSEPRHHLLAGNQWDVAQRRGRDDHDRSENSKHFSWLHFNYWQRTDPVSQLSGFWENCPLGGTVTPLSDAKAIW